MGREIYDIINDMAEVLNASQMQKLQGLLVKRLSENTVSDYLQTTNMDFLDMFLTAKHLEGCSEMSDGTWQCDGHIYKYRLEISGRLSNAVKDSTYIYLSNIEDITFEQAWKASGLSSNMDDYFDIDEAVLVELPD